ncbi:NHL repeat-containing protein [Streptomyces sp. NPDC127108]|uniref:NHL repeat-containing protein n=1 Tax=Streptomyces sp. NPDC127108 TaxID=3345361 RepID=UPI003631684D
MTTAHAPEPDGTITTVVGSGRIDYLPGIGQATSAQLSFPWGVAADAQGNVYVADNAHHTVYKATPSGVLSVVAGNGTAGYSGDGGPGPAAQLNQPLGTAVDAQGNVYFAEWSNHRVRKVTPAGVITTVAGNGPGGYSGEGVQATSALLAYPADVAVDGAGNLYIAANDHHRVYKVTPAGVLTTVAGKGTAGFSGDGGPATAAQLYHPRAVAVDGEGSVYIADQVNHRVRKVRPDGVITTVAGNGPGGYSGEGIQATSALLNHPLGVAVDAAGNVFIGGNEQHRVYKVDPKGILTTVAGKGSGGYGGDGLQAVAGQVYHPRGVALDGQGNLYLADHSNHRVRKVTGVARAATPPPPAADLYGDVVRPHSVQQSREFDLGARIKNRGPNPVGGQDVTVVLTLADGLTGGPGTGRRLTRTFPGAQLVPNEGSFDGTFRITAPADTPPGVYTSTLEIQYGGELNLKDNAVNLPVVVVAPEAVADETVLDIHQETVPDAAPGQATKFNVVYSSPTGTPVNAGVITQRYTAPSGFEFVGQPTYGYYSTIHGVITGNLDKYRIEGGGQTLVIEANPHVNTTDSDTSPLVYTLGIRAQADAEPGLRTDGSAAIGKHPPVQIAAKVTGGGHDETALRVEQETVPEAKPGGTTTFNIEIRSLNDVPVDPGPIVQTFTAPTGFAFTGGASYGYYYVKPPVTGNLDTTVQDGGRTLVIETDPHVNTGTTDRTALLYTLSVRVLPDAKAGTYDDGKAAIGRLAPVPLTGHVL